MLRRDCPASAILKWQETAQPIDRDAASRKHLNVDVELQDRTESMIPAMMGLATSYRAIRFRNLYQLQDFWHARLTVQMAAHYGGKMLMARESQVSAAGMWLNHSDQSVSARVASS